jgi:ubiquinone/menaquinone biosynthesis C-methylase UbiE
MHANAVIRVRAMEWSAGRYEVIAEQLLPAARVVVEEAAPGEGDRVVDVGCGTGNAALLAAESGATVTGVDPAERLIEVATAEAQSRGLDASFVAGEAADLPLPDSSADIVISLFGAIFAPDPQAAIDEMVRVLAPEGRMLLAAWIPDGAISRAVRLTRQTVSEVLGQPPPEPPFPWHERDALQELFDRHGMTVSMGEHSISFSAPSPEQFIDTEGENHPLAVAARPALEKAGRADELREGLLNLYEEANEDPDAFRVTSRYVIAEVRRPG